MGLTFLFSPTGEERHISGILKVDGKKNRRLIRLSRRSDGQRIAEGYSSSDTGEYRFQCIEKDVEYDLRAMDENRQYRDVTLDAVVGKEII